eukprot:536699-Alexandrium_andersonii.AAC.1
MPLGTSELSDCSGALLVALTAPAAESERGGAMSISKTQTPSTLEKSVARCDLQLAILPPLEAK